MRKKVQFDRISECEQSFILLKTFFFHPSGLTQAHSRGNLISLSCCICRGSKHNTHQRSGEYPEYDIFNIKGIDQSKDIL